MCHNIANSTSWDASQCIISTVPIAGRAEPHEINVDDLERSLREAEMAGASQLKMPGDAKYGEKVVKKANEKLKAAKKAQACDQRTGAHHADMGCVGRSPPCAYPTTCLERRAALSQEARGVISKSQSRLQARRTPASALLVHCARDFHGPLAPVPRGRPLFLAALHLRCTMYTGSARRRRRRVRCWRFFVLTRRRRTCET